MGSSIQSLKGMNRTPFITPLSLLCFFHVSGILGKATHQRKKMTGRVLGLLSLARFTPIKKGTHFFPRSSNSPGTEVLTGLTQISRPSLN